MGNPMERTEPVGDFDLYILVTASVAWRFKEKSDLSLATLLPGQLICTSNQLHLAPSGLESCPACKSTISTFQTSVLAKCKLEYYPLTKFSSIQVMYVTIGKKLVLNVPSWCVA